MRALYDSKSKGNDRGIKKLLTKEAKIESWLLAEAALADAQAEEGFIPRSAADNIIENAKLESIWKKWIAFRQRWAMALYHL